MISISKNRLFKIIKIGFIILALYMATFFALKAVYILRYYNEKVLLTESIASNKVEINKLIQQETEAMQKLDILQKTYISQDDLEEKLEGIFHRISLPDYNLKYIASTKLCIDRYVLMVQLKTKSPNGLKAGKGILSYLGKIQQSKQRDDIYFVDYILNTEDK